MTYFMSKTHFMGTEGIRKNSKMRDVDICDHY